MPKSTTHLIQIFGLITSLGTTMVACGGASAEDACKNLGEKYRSCDTDGTGTPWISAFDALCIANAKASTACAKATIAIEKCYSQHSCTTLNDPTSTVCQAEGETFADQCTSGSAMQDPNSQDPNAINDMSDN